MNLGVGEAESEVERDARPPAGLTLEFGQLLRDVAAHTSCLVDHDLAPGRHHDTNARLAFQTPERPSRSPSAHGMAQPVRSLAPSAATGRERERERERKRDGPVSDVT